MQVQLWSDAILPCMIHLFLTRLNPDLSERCCICCRTQGGWHCSLESLPPPLLHGTLGTRQELMNDDAGSAGVEETRAAELDSTIQAKHSSGLSSNPSWGRNWTVFLIFSSLQGPFFYISFDENPTGVMLVTAPRARLPWEQKNRFKTKSYFLECIFLSLFFGMNKRSSRYTVKIVFILEIHICLRAAVLA